MEVIRLSLTLPLQGGIETTHTKLEVTFEVERKEYIGEDK